MEPRTVQAYLEQGPAPRPGRTPPGFNLSTTQWLVWSLATAGKFFEGLIVFMGGIALPLVTRQFGLGGGETGLLTAATLFGILIGALSLGGLADRWGRKPVFVGEMLLLAVALIGASLSVSPGMLVISLFLIGLALGADYPTAHLVISEAIPADIRGRLVLGAFGFQAFGALLAMLIAAQLLSLAPGPVIWRQLYLLPVLPVLLVAWGRLSLPESSHWLMSRGHTGSAEQALGRLLGRDDIRLDAAEQPGAAGEPIEAHGNWLFPVHQRRTVPGHNPGEHPTAPGDDWQLLFRGRYQRATILASVPWFLQDLSTYGIGLFTPVIIAAAFGAEDPGTTFDAQIHNLLLGARGTALVDVGFLIGIAIAIALADRLGRIPLQIIGFIGCSIGLLIAAAGSAGASRNLPLIVSGFFLFQLMTNLGPNAQTYLLAGEVFPTRIRGLGAGFAAAAGKAGAVITAFCFPVLLKQIGSERLLPMLAFTSLIGAWITWLYRIETTGKPID